MKPFFFILIVAVFVACNNSPRQNEALSGDSVETTTAQADPLLDDQCYLFVSAKDTYALKINIIDTVVRGTAVFANYEKDSSHGTVEGEVDGNIIHLWYNFQSEGMNSVRELYLKKDGEKLVTGIANEATKGDTAYVPDAKSVQYNGTVYTLGDCAAIPKF